MKHSNIVGSSTAKRRYYCPGSIDLEAEAPAEQESPFAAEGTALHSAMEYILDRGVQPRAVAGMSFYDHEMTAERVGLLKQCMTEFEKVVPKGAEFDLEKTLPFPGIDHAFGTGDVLWYDGGNTMWERAGIVDWKFGQGVPVYTPGNMQAKFLLCGMRAADPDIGRGTKLFATFVQPRLDYAETVEFSHKELDAFEADLKHAVFHRRYGEDPLAIGDWCQFCKAKLFCPKQKERFDRFRKMAAVGNDVGAILDAAKGLQDLIKAAEAAAYDILDGGGEVPGYKLVQKTGNRAWINEAATDRWLAKLGVPAKARRTVPKLVSPAQMDKLRPDLKDRLATRWENPDRGFALAPETDRRPPVLKGKRLNDALAKALDKSAKT